MSNRLTRRRFLSISAAGAAVAAGDPSAVMASQGHLTRWNGQALGAPVSMRLSGVSTQQARPVFKAVERELARLERVFSLFDRQSELSRLNAAGRLNAPSADLVSVLRLCDRLHTASQGAFDPTVQPLWELYAHAVRNGVSVDRKSEADMCKRIGWRYVQFDADEICLKRPEMALTLNGIAQGYVTDQIAALLRRRGLTDVLIDMGEIAAIGQRADGPGWSVGVAMPDGTLINRITLKDRALSTSSPSGTVLDSQGRIGHILDPRSAGRGGMHQLVSVSSHSAAIADGISTAGCLMSHPELMQTIGSFPKTKLENLI